MRSRQRQRGLGWFGLLFIFALIGFAALVAIRCTPIYLNQMKIAKSVHDVANNPELASTDNSGEVYSALLRYWDIERIDYLQYKDVKINRSERTLSYKYEARTPLFYNISIVIEFDEKIPFSGRRG